MKKIMIVDDNVTNLNVARKALENEYEVYPILDGEKALKIMAKKIPDLILLDVEMPGMNGFDVLRKIKELGSPFDEIPVIFVTASDDTNSEYEGLNLGAVDYVTKPFSFTLLLKRVELHLRQAEQQKTLYSYSSSLENRIKTQTKKIEDLQYSIVHVLCDMVERRDGCTGQHIIRTSEYLKVLLYKAQEMGVYQDELMDANIELYSHASKLHDIGKVAIQDTILLKEGKLSDIEYEIMKTHTTIGENEIHEALKIAEDSPFLMVASNFVGYHHEKWDGTGYPRNLKGEEIPICGRLMAIADVYDALISTRPYKAPKTHEDAIKIMYDGDGTHFDPVLMKVFREVNNEFKLISEKYRDVEKVMTIDGLLPNI